MADDDGDPTKRQQQQQQHQNKETTFQTVPEARAEFRSPNRNSGIVEVPVGSRGPRSIYIRRDGDSFGFTLRHFIIYPPESFGETDGRHAAVGALRTPMDTIFVKSVAKLGPADQSGLQQGDRILAVNRESVNTLTYSQVVYKIQTSPQYLHLLVVPKEEDVLQRYFSDTAYHPVSNQNAEELLLNKRRNSNRHSDSTSWKSLDSHNFDCHLGERRSVQTQKSADNIYSSIEPNVILRRHQKSADNIYSSPSLGEDGLNDSVHTSRAQPQVPKKMGRRVSENATVSPDDAAESKMKGASYTGGGVSHDASYLSTFNCRLSSDIPRRESSCSSLTSSATDESKDSFVSYDSVSTLTGHETDDSLMARLKKSFQDKEEFLRRPNQPAVTLAPKEFYARPKKLDKPVWPPSENIPESPSRLAKPTHHNFQRVKNDIESEREINANNVLKDANQRKETPVNGNVSDSSDDRRNYPNSHMVSKRARQFETGCVVPEGDPLAADRTSYYKSELARISAKRTVPNVAVRTKEFETLSSSDARRELAFGNTASALRRSYRDSRSLDSSDLLNEVERVKPRARSNSIGSWAQANDLRGDPKEEGHEPMLTDTVAIGGNAIPKKTPPAVSVTPATPVPSSVISNPPLHIMQQSPSAVIIARPTDLDLAAPKRPMRYLKPPHDYSHPPVQPAYDKESVVRRTKNTNLSDEDRVMRRESYLKATEGGRMHFDSSDMMSDGDVSPQVLRSAHRRWRPPLFPGDIQQLRKLFEDTTSSLGGSLSGGSSSSASLDREKILTSPVGDKERLVCIKEGPLHLKITEIDGKRYTDRSWKQIWAVVKGPKLFFYKDRHQQSPIGTSEVAEQSLASGVDMRGSSVQVADDYTKRKHVLRVSSVLPCRSELLLQAESTDEFAEWVHVLQEQVAVSTDSENKLDSNGTNGGKQQAVPQTIAANSSIQISGKSKLPTLRNRSPTGQSPVSKTRKPSNTNGNDPSTSPKSKTWRGRMVKQFRKIHQGASSPSSPTAPEGSTFGNLLEQCPLSPVSPYVPKIVELCTDIVESRGLEVVGIYRVPGNSAAVTALTEEVNKSEDEIVQVDPRWADVHVVSSLLKSFFRKMPDSLLTTGLYPLFIEADKVDDPRRRLEEIRRLINSLPIYNYHTLKHLILHLMKIVDHSDVNKMEARNLAIVFGPTIVRTGEENMEKMVSDMTHQCKIVESLLVFGEWFFSNESVDSLELAAPIAAEESSETDFNTTLLKNNISKMEGLTQHKELKEKFKNTLFSAAQKKTKKKSKEQKEDPQSPTGIRFLQTEQLNSNSHDLKDSTTEQKLNPITTNNVQIQTATLRNSNGLFNYKTDDAEFKRRVKDFQEETLAYLSRQRKPECNSNNSLDIPNHQINQLSSSVANVRHSFTVQNSSDERVITKTHSASNVFNRSTLSSNNRDSGATSLPYVQTSGANHNSNTKDSSSDISSASSDSKAKPITVRRGSSVENITNADLVNANGKKIKYEKEREPTLQKSGSLDSLNKLQNIDDGGDLVSTITKIFDEKKRELNPSLLSVENIPYADESPEKKCMQSASYLNKENIPGSPKLYRNPSLHKSQYSGSKLLSTYQNVVKLKEKQEAKEKDEDSSMNAPFPDNERHLALGTSKLNILLTTGTSKLKRSESLNKPERTCSPLSHKLKRSESLNKDRLKRSDSLTKNEKTECNINKKREINGSRRIKDTKLKRKNGMPDRSIKRRHTVGGYPDKINLLDNRNCEETTITTESKKEKSLRTSSPDLSSARRDRSLLEINFITSENMVLSLRQHFIGARPQSFPDTNVYKVPLESHV